MYAIFITGANRGIGLEFVKQYAHDQHHVFASYHPACPFDELQKLAAQHKNISLIPLDVTNEDQIACVAQQLEHKPIDILINNAGIFGRDQDLATISACQMVQVFTVNAVGPLLMAKHFINHVATSTLKTIASVSSRMGSISYVLEHKGLTRAYAYRTSKTALNMIMANIALDTYDKGIKILLFHPGHVATALGQQVQGVMIDATTSVAGMRKLILEAPRSLEKFFYTYSGERMPW
jgi:NAD(P)-dependent dehydrogenase (short-subunit alcohol dehydrogenase family)